MEEAHLPCHVAGNPVAELYMSAVLLSPHTVCFAGVFYPIGLRSVVKLVCFFGSMLAPFVVVIMVLVVEYLVCCC